MFMKIRGVPGRYEFHLETDQERAIFGHAMRESVGWFKQFEDGSKRALHYWGDAEMDGEPTQAFIVATWDERDYTVSGQKKQRLVVDAPQVE
jgi:hypothetical protein